MQIVLAPAPVGHQLASALGIHVLGNEGYSTIAICPACETDGLRIGEEGDAACRSCERSWRPWDLIKAIEPSTTKAIGIANECGITFPQAEVLNAINEDRDEPRPAPAVTKNGHVKPTLRKQIDILDSTPPHDDEAEQIVLNAIFASPAIMGDMCGLVAPGDFYSESNRLLFSFMVTMHRDNEPMLGNLVAGRLKDAGMLDRIGGISYLIELTSHPPQPPDYVRHFAGVVRELANRRRIIDTAADVLQRAYSGGQSVELRQSLMESAQDIESISGFKIEWLDAYDLLTGDFSTQYLIPGILARGQSCGIIAPPKCLKTNLAADMAVSLALGGRFCGYFPDATPVNVGFISVESGISSLQDVIKRIMNAAGRRFEDIRGKLILSGTRPNLADLLHVRTIERDIKRNKLEVLFLDPAYLMMDLDGREGSLFAVGQQLREIDGMCQQNGVTFILVHHATAAAGRAAGPPSLHDAAWSGFAAFFRQWIVLRHREEFQPETGTSRLWIRSGGSAGHYDLHGLTVCEGRQEDEGGRRWEVQVERIGEVAGDIEARKQIAKEQEKIDWLEKDRSTIVEILAKTDGLGMTKTDIKEHANIRTDRFGAAFSSLLRENVIIQMPIIKGNNRTYGGYRLNEFAT